MFETLRQRRAFGQDQSGHEVSRSGAITRARTASMQLHNGLPPWASLDGARARWAPAQLLSLSSVIRQWRQRARTRQQLRRLSDHMLKDIGLRREDVGHEFPTPFGRFD